MHGFSLPFFFPFFFFFFFSLKATQEEINHEGETQLHPLAAGRNFYLYGIGFWKAEGCLRAGT